MTSRNSDHIELVDVSKDLDKLRTDFQRMKRKVHELQSKLDWYERVVKTVGMVIFLIFVRIAITHERKENLNHVRVGNDKHAVYKEVETSNSWYNGMMVLSKKAKNDVHGVRHGFGYEYFKEVNCKMEGYFQNDKVEGYGFWASGESGSTYRGSHVNSIRNGHGVFQKANGDRYEGRFVDGHLNDTFAKVTFANHSTYIGSFYNKMLNGHGTYIWPDGTQYKGNWEDGKPSSEGTFLVPIFRSIPGSFEEYSEIMLKEEWERARKQ
eukprot:CAMPEP_0178929606 /NCGR_PEP_ID=MMETSP0786-20121207/20710_1 /TAXON_ID=186022 /ORGANISM="Thalassionema frauenfeldii, Strain CCMP 1798" /LENGTH=265 /DNA_ID=CAMNT_0020605915 /DNA_START=46 /DNA_END=843 /DNA_ORIENTATION=-